jgi:hypothetical protein
MVLTILSILALAHGARAQAEISNAEAAVSGEFACGPASEKHRAFTDKKSHPTPPPPEGKAILYVVRPTMFGNQYQTKLGINGKWVGINRGNNYFWVILEPGTYHLCSQLENKATASITVEAGKTYYVQQKIQAGGFAKARNSLTLLTHEEGGIALGKSHPSRFELKD